MLSNEFGVLNGLHGRVVLGPLLLVDRAPGMVLLVMVVMVVALERRAGQPVVRGGGRAEHVVVLVLGVDFDRVLVLVVIRRHVHHGVVGASRAGRARRPAPAATIAADATAAVHDCRQRRWYAVVEAVTAVVTKVLVDLGRHVEHAAVLVVVVLVDRVLLFWAPDEQHFGQYLNEQLHHPRPHLVRHRRPRQNRPGHLQ